jgi:hypothetical protein
MRPPRRYPPVWIALILVIVALGLGSRRYTTHLPNFMAAYAGDTLWAAAAYLGLGLLLPRASTWTVALLAMSFSVMIEVSQLYKAPWIDSIRHTTLGGLVLGFDFVWSDLACYAVGVMMGMLVERGLGGTGADCPVLPRQGDGDEQPAATIDPR